MNESKSNSSDMKHSETANEQDSQCSANNNASDTSSTTEESSSDESIAEENHDDDGDHDNNDQDTSIGSTPCFVYKRQRFWSLEEIQEYMDEEDDLELSRQFHLLVMLKTTMYDSRHCTRKFANLIVKWKRGKRRIPIVVRY